MHRIRFVFLALVIATSVCAFAKEQPKIVLNWPADKPVVRVTFGQFSLIGRYQKNNSYVIDADVENLSSTPLPYTNLTLVFFDKEGAQIGNAWLSIEKGLMPSQKAKRQISFSTLGTPVRFQFEGPKDLALSRDHSAVAHAAAITVRSVPTGANIEIDGTPFGQTPKILRVPEGSHTLVLSKAGYENARYPFDVGENDASGGTIEVELPTANDILELRDGTTVGGDVESVSWDKIRIVVGGKPIEYSRNLVKRISLVQRQVSTP